MKKIITLLILVLTFSVNAQQLAFPTAEGAGANASGGRGGTVLHVTTLDWNDTQGSLKWALEQTYPRTIVFDVSGTIDVTSTSKYYELHGQQYSDLTIAGQTAPEGGITIEHNWFNLFDIDNVIIRYIRFVHVGYFNSDESGPINATAFSFGGSGYNMLDHISTRYSWNSVGMGIRGANYGMLGTSIQRCLVGDSKTGIMVGENPTIEADMINGANHSVHHNLVAHISHRFPSMSGNGNYEAINNVIYNPRERLALSFGTPNVNFIGNYFKSGSQQLLGVNKVGTYVGLYNTNIKPHAQWYTEGNIIEGTNYAKTDTDWTDDPTTYPSPVDANFMVRWGDDDGDGDEWKATHEFADPLLYRSLTKFPDINANAPVTIQDVDVAYLDVLADVGANKYINADGSVGTYIDTVDQRYITETTNGTGSYATLSDQSSLVYPVLPNNTRPAGFYVSNSHIPEAFLKAQGLTGTSTIHNETAPSGYTWLEEYINQVDGVIAVPQNPTKGEIAKKYKILIINE